MRNRIYISIIAAALLSAQVTAQTAKTFISPLEATKIEGSGSNSFPYSSTTVRRYMQIHSDLPTGAMSIKSIGYRISQSTVNFTGTRTLDMEMWMGRTVDHDKCSFLMDDNWLTNSKTLVVKRKKINFGPAGQGVSPGPNPFVAGLTIPLDAPYTYVSIASFGWMVAMHGNVANGTVPILDVHKAVSVNGSASSSGGGCVATGRASPMSQIASITDMGGALLMRFGANNAPTSAASWLMLGSKNPALTIPGLCGKLQTNLLAVLPIGTSETTGKLNDAYTNAAPGVLVLPNSIPGATLYSQIFSLDPGQKGFWKLAVSDGMKVAIPTSGTKGVRVTRLFNNINGVTEKRSSYFGTSTVGYGLVIQLTY